MTKDDINHVHDEECGCGCGCGQEEQDLVVLVDEEGNEHSFVLCDMIEVDDQSYALLTPAEPEEDDDEDEDVDTVYIFRMVDDENGEKQLISVDDDEELERVFAAWEELDGDWDMDDSDSDDSDD
jgi:uncharacterized protein YrzB (UPF0473 family)